jgi:hypothetical protein
MIPELSLLHTQFRITVIAGDESQFYLQFFFKDAWRFIPRVATTIAGEMLVPQECPTAINPEQAFQFVSRKRPAKKKLIRFARKYSNIRDYFIRCNRLQFKAAKQQERKEQLSEYLTVLKSRVSYKSS